MAYRRTQTQILTDYERTRVLNSIDEMRELGRGVDDSIRAGQRILHAAWKLRWKQAYPDWRGPAYRANGKTNLGKV